MIMYSWGVSSEIVNNIHRMDVVNRKMDVSSEDIETSEIEHKIYRLHLNTVGSSAFYCSKYDKFVLFNSVTGAN